MQANIRQELSRRTPGGLADDSNVMDTASLVVCNGLSTPVELFGQVDECADCAFQSLSNGPIAPGDNATVLTLTTSYAYRLELRPYTMFDSTARSTPPPAFELCGSYEHLEEYGAYVWNVGHHPNCGGLPPSSWSNDGSICEWRQVKAGSSSLLPIVVLLGATLFGLPLVFQLARLLLRVVALWSPAVHSGICSAAGFLADPHTSNKASSGGDGTATQEGGQQKGSRVRVRSVDVLRGAAIAVMIFANYGSGAYAGMNHAIWNGIHLADWACPCFVFVMGLSIAITNRRDARRIREAIYAPPADSLRLPLNSGLPEFGGANTSTCARLKRGAIELAKLVYRISRRSLLLFAIGVSLSNAGFGEYASLRIFGVLQRLSLTYLFTSLATLPVFLAYAPADTIAASEGNALSGGLFWDLTRFWPEWLPILALVALQTGLEFGIDPANWNATSVASMKGCPRGYLGPGGLHWNGSYPTCTGGAHRLLDLWLLGDKHLEPFPTTVMVYQTTVPFDDNALLGTCCSVLLCFLGLQAGKVLLFSRSDRERAIRWAVWTVLLALLTLPFVLIPSPYQFNSSLLPINKNLWYFWVSII